MKRLLSEIAAAIHSFSVREQFALAVLGSLFIAAALGLLVQVNQRYWLVTVPASGGILTEGVLGTPRFINPLLAISDADRDLTALIYSGLLRVQPDGQLAPDLAESYQISPDAREYTFILKEGLTFHDGAPLTAADIEFTVHKAQDPLIKSTRRAAWEGVTVEKISDREIRFQLKQSYAPFLENATLGILPRHIWQSVSPDAFPLDRHNIEPIGSGPFKLSNLKFDRAGLPLRYELKPFNRFALGRPKLSRLVIRFFGNEDDLLSAFHRGEIESMSAIPPEVAAALQADGRAVVLSATLPRVFGVFFNQNEKDLFTWQEVREALDLAINKDRIVAEVLKGFGEVIDGPLPPLALGGARTVTAGADRLEAAAERLRAGGWKQDESGRWSKNSKTGDYRLAFTLSAPSTPELKLVAELIAKDWRDLGAEVTTQIFELSDLNQNVIRPRKYETLFFGEILGRDPDPFAFWHSSQRLDPGLNIALYTSITADKLLADARAAVDRNERQEKLAAFAAEVKADRPASFVYSPAFIYVVPKKIIGLNLPPAITPADRFANIHEWYTGVDRIWKFFAR